MDSIVERQRGIVTEHIRGENEHDWPAVYDTFVQDDRAYYDVVPLGTRFKGIEGVRSSIRLLRLPCPTCTLKSHLNTTCRAAPSVKWLSLGLIKESSRV